MFKKSFSLFMTILFLLSTVFPGKSASFNEQSLVWNSYEDPKLGFRLEYPESWYLEPGHFIDAYDQIYQVSFIESFEQYNGIEVTIFANPQHLDPLDFILTNGRGWDQCIHCPDKNSVAVGEIETPLGRAVKITGYPVVNSNQLVVSKEGSLISFTTVANYEGVPLFSLTDEQGIELQNYLFEFVSRSSFPQIIELPRQEKISPQALDAELPADSFRRPTDSGDAYNNLYGTKNPGLRFNGLDWSPCYEVKASELLHAGTDFGGSGSTAVRAVANGHVEKKGSYSPGQGVVLHHTLPSGEEVFSFYGHLDQVLVNENQIIEKGDLLGYLKYQPNNTHTHFEIRSWGITQENWCKSIAMSQFGPGYTPDGIHPNSRGYKDPLEYIKNHLTITEPPTLPPPPPSVLQGSKNISVPFRWYFSINTGDPRIQNVYLDGNKIFYKPACAKYLWISGGNHVISFDYENSGSGVPEVNLSYWPFASAACAADTFEPPPDSPAPTPSVPVALSDNATIVADITIPDGSIFSPGQSLTKTWRLQNSGSTTWSSGYQLVFLRGDRMGAPASINVPSTAPGQNADLSVSITAPSSPGSYTGYWRLRNPQGTYFGPEIWVSLEVATQGSHITVFSADPPPPSDTTSVRIRARVENFSNFRALRMKVGNQVICEETTLEATCSWNTAGYAAGSHNIMVEVADQTDTSWTRSEKRSMVYTLTGTGASSNHIPNRPTLASPYDWYVYYSGNTANLCAQANGDPDGDAITGYYFDVTGAETWNSGWVSNSCVNTAGMGPHTYGWRVKVRDSRGGESDWSDSWHYTLVNPSLSITQLDFQALDANSEQVRIRACTAGQGGIGITMKVMVNEANDGSGNGKWNTIYELGVPCFNDTDAPTWHTLKYSDGTHRVRVEAHGLNTGWDGAAVRESTYTLPHRRPSGSILYAPVPLSGNTNEAVYLNNQSITFKWENVLRNNSYTLYVSTTTNPQTDPNPVLNHTVGSNVTEYTAPFNQEYSVLYWQVLSNGDAGTSSSNIQKFGIDRTSPSCTVQVLSPTVFDNAFKVSWQGSDDVAGVASYDIQYLDTNRSEWVDWQTNQPASKTFDMFAGQPGHTYSFRCRSMDAAGNQSAYPSSPDTFTKIDPTTRPPEPWWNSAYAYKRSLIILNNDSDWMPPHFPVRVHFDGSTTPTASEIYNASLSTVKGNDVRIIYQNQTELNRMVQRFSSSQIDIWLPLQSGLGSGASDSTNYQIYYGNASSGNPPADAGAVFSPEADANTMGLWHFQEGGGSTSLDSSGRNHNGNYNNVGWVDGPTGWAVSFSGTSSSVKIPHTSDFNTNAMTIEAWIYVTYFDGTEWPMVWKSVPYTPGGFEFRFNHDRGINFNNDLTSGRWDVQSDPIEAGRWYHVAGTFNGSNQGCIYINGNLSRCRTYNTGSQRYNSGEIRIGLSWEGSGDKYFPGYIQHVRLSNIARTDFPYARIDTQPSVAVGVQQTPAVAGEADLAVVSLNTYPDPSGGILVEAVVKNQGTVSTTNGFYTDLYINHLPTGTGDYTGSLQFWVNDPIPAGSTTTLTTVVTDLSQIGLAASVPGEEKRGTLYVQTDSTGALTETDKANNISTSGTEICVISPDAFEGDETSADAHLLGASQQHNFDRPNDEDWVKLVAQQGQTYKIQTSNLGPNADTYLYLYGPDGVTLLASNDDFNGTLASQIEWTAPADGTYYVQVKQWNPSLGGCGTGYTIGTGGVQPAIYLPLVIR